MIQEFRNNEQGYLNWLNQHPNGFVLNSRQEVDSEYMVLHKAICRAIKSYRNMKISPGGFTERAYVKICSNNIRDLQKWTKANGRSDGSFSKKCKLCLGEKI